MNLDANSKAKKIHRLSLYCRLETYKNSYNNSLVKNLNEFKNWSIASEKQL